MSLLVPLSSVDQAGTETSLSVFGYVLAGHIDADALRSAALRLVDKWRLLAGTLEWANGTYNVRVPLGPLDAGERVRFTRTALPSTPLPLPVPRAEDAAWTMRPPAYKYFVHRDTAGALATLAKRGLPILSIHVTSFADYTCVGIAAPHGVLDGTGQGALTQYLDAELNGRPWTPPPFAPANILQAALDGLHADPPPEKASDLLFDLRRELVPVSARTVASLAARVAYEYLWHRAEDRVLFLGREVIEKLARRVKEEVRARDPSGAQWVSTGDVIYMWLVQAACAGEAQDAAHTVGLMSAVSLRPLLTEHTKNPDFETYPHNCLVPTALPLLDKKRLQQTSLAELCLIHRGAIARGRSIEYVRAWTRGVRTSLPARRIGHDSWICSNQIVSRSTEIDFGAPTRAYFYFMAPLMPDHTLLINELNGGYVVQGCLRRARWEAIDRSLQELLAA